MDDVPRRTVPIKLDVPEERCGDLHQTKKQFLHCPNHTSEWVWRIDDHCVTSKSKAVDALYGEHREETDLNARMIEHAVATGNDIDSVLLTIEDTARCADADLLSTLQRN